MKKITAEPVAENFPESGVEFEMFGMEPPTQGSMKVVGRVGRGLMVDIHKDAIDKYRPLIAKAIREAASDASISPKTPVRVEMLFRLPRPKTVKTSRPVAKKDVDKLSRGANDAISAAGLWGDDGQVTVLSSRKSFPDEGCPAGVRVHIMRDENLWELGEADRVRCLSLAGEAMVSMGLVSDGERVKALGCVTEAEFLDCLPLGLASLWLSNAQAVWNFRDSS